MKLIVSLCLVLLFSADAALGQAKRITEKVGKRVEKRNEQTQEALKSGAAPGEKPAEPPPTPSVAAPAPNPTVSTNKPLKVIRKKMTSENDAATKKLVDFQRQRALSGQASAQYDLGMRYLNGDGVEENAEEGRKWIEKAAKQENSAAIKKLEELNRSKK